MLAKLTFFSKVSHKSFFLSLFLASSLFFVALSPVFAQNPLDGIACQPGKTMAENKSKCGVDQIKESVKNLIRFVVKVVLIVALVVMVGSTLFDFYQTKGGPQFYIKSRAKIAGIVVGLLLLAAAFNLGSILRELQVNPNLLKYLDYILSSLPIDRAYAQGATSFFSSNLTLWEIILAFVKVIWTWLVFPLMVGGWFYAGFQYVGAQGNPEKVKDAHGTLLAIVLITVFVLFVQALLISLIGK
jgi:hypothetical protein